MIPSTHKEVKEADGRQFKYRGIEATVKYQSSHVWYDQRSRRCKWQTLDINPGNHDIGKVSVALRSSSFDSCGIFNFFKLGFYDVSAERKIARSVLFLRHRHTGSFRWAVSSIDCHNFCCHSTFSPTVLACHRRASNSKKHVSRGPSMPSAAMSACGRRRDIRERRRIWTVKIHYE